MYRLFSASSHARDMLQRACLSYIPEYDAGVQLLLSASLARHALMAVTVHGSLCRAVYFIHMFSSYQNQTAVLPVSQKTHFLERDTKQHCFTV